jgi:hypothetical protein
VPGEHRLRQGRIFEPELLVGFFGFSRVADDYRRVISAGTLAYCTCLARLERSSAGELGKKLVVRWAQVAASEARICQVRAPFGVLLPQEILRAITAGRSWRSARLLVALTPS